MHLARESGPCTPRNRCTLSAVVFVALGWTASQAIGQPAWIDVSPGLPQVRYGSLAWGDYDSDGDLDLVVAGELYGNDVARIYRNDGEGVFVDSGAGLVGVRQAAVAWGDYDGDGDLDLAVSGITWVSYRGFVAVSKVHRNDSGSFTDVGAPLFGLRLGSIAWADFDNDGDLDLLITGATYEEPLYALTILYRNDAGSFRDVYTGLPGVFSSSIAWGDYDNDGDLDLAMCGTPGAGMFTGIYRNDGGGIFTDIQAGLTAVASGSLAWGDYDHDGDLDLAVCGNGTAQVYRNDSGSFIDIHAELPGASVSSLAWGDYDGDGDLDLALSGGTATTPFVTVCRNDGGDVFTDTHPPMAGVSSSTVAWGDYDRDGDLDLAVSGESSGILGPGTTIYRNDIAAANTPPVAPSELSAGVEGQAVTLSWSAASDAQTPATGLTYNLRVGTTPGGSQIFSGMANPATGLRTIPARGNVQKRLSWKLRNLSFGTVYWSVQAVDTAFAGSPWAPEMTFTVFRPLVDSGAVLTSVANGAIAWGDYDNDGDLDLVVTGRHFTESGPEPIGRIYRNDGGAWVDSGVNIIPVQYSAVAWGDYDNDGDLDLAVAGDAGNDQYVSRIYRNDEGVFTDIEVSLPALAHGSLGWADIDNDGDLDLALVGLPSPSSFGGVLWIYRNDGGGRFTNTGATLTNVSSASLAWGDYDNDGWVDLAVAGSDWRGTYSEPSTRIYHNNGGTFVDSGISVIQVTEGSLAWGDYDNDGDLDLAIAGTGAVGNLLMPVTRIYRNDGGGVFTYVDAPLQGLQVSSLAWGDYDNDGRLDLAVAGYDGSFYVSKVYRNTGDGSFEDSDADLPGLSASSVAWGDYDGDGRLDLALAGYFVDGSPHSATHVFRNVGALVPNTPPVTPADLAVSAEGSNVTFSWAAASDTQTPAAGLSYNLRVGRTPGGTEVFAGMADPATGLRRLPATGNTQKRLAWTLSGLTEGTYYWSVQAIDTSFAGSPWATEQSIVVAPPLAAVETAIVGVSDGTLAWGDYDNDGDLDLAIAGKTGTGRVSRIYRNDGGGTFTDINAGLVGVSEGELAWGDYDNDGDLDLAIAGFVGGTTRVSKIYRNDGGGTFTDIAAPLTGVSQSALAWGDYDNDGDLDLVLSGDPFGAYITKIYRNNGPAGFTDANAGLTGVFDGSLAWADIDNDGDLDLAVTGSTGSAYLGRTYRNNAGVWTYGAGLVGVHGSSIAWGDYDNDGDLDLVESGVSINGTAVTQLLRNNGSGTLSTVSTSLLGVLNGAVAWGDFDNDGDLDLAVAGDRGGEETARIYRNDGNDVFTYFAALTGVSACSLAWGDYDGDGRLDLIVAGNSGASKVTRLYRNVTALANTPPAAPDGLAVSSTPDGVTFSWAAASDSQTPAAGLSYNLRIGTRPGAADISSGMADLGTGLRRVPALGNAQQRLSWTAQGLPDGIYYWSVQAVDTAFTGSVWAPEQTSEIHRPFANANLTLAQMNHGALAWGDFDNDGDLDLVASGQIKPLATKLYRNDGSGGFTEITTSLPGVYGPALAWCDYDGDGDLDLAIAGSTSFTASVPIARIYRNEGAGVFTDINAGLIAVTDPAIAWGDYDKDGRPDLAIAGFNASNGPLCRIYRNAGGGVFTDINAGLERIVAGSVAWGDYDNDGDLDLVAAGYNGTTLVTRLYRNDAGVFASVNTALVGVGYWSTVAWGDFDNDGDLDLALMGIAAGGFTGRIYRNDGGGVFTDINAGLVVREYGTLAWGDYDNDGDLDLVLTGDSSPGATAHLYRNDGGVFVDAGVGLPGLSAIRNRCALAFGDYDNDGRLDLAMLGGVGPNVTPLTRIYRNGMLTANTPPSPPASQSLNISGTKTTFSWSAGSDAQTPTAGLSYNLRVGTAPGRNDVFAGMADAASGRRRIPSIGNTQLHPSWTLRDLAPGVYYWSVQTIDSGGLGSVWSGEQWFATTFSPADFNRDGDVDQDDFAVFASCRSGAGIPRVDTADCRAADFDGDQDVDQSDFGTFQRCYSGADRPADPKCGL